MNRLSVLSRPRGVPFFLMSATALALAACSSGGGAGNSSGGASGGGHGHGKGPSGPPEAGYVVVQSSAVPLTAELSGRTAAYQTSEVRPQVSGLIQARKFTEGAIVHKGEVLYQIDPSLYRAATNQAQANLTAAQATAEASRILAERYRPLAQAQAVAQQDYTNAAATARQNAAQVEQNRAALQTARINLHFTTVPAPITGRIGRSLFTVGALVTASQTDPLAVIQQMDPMYVDIQQSAAQLLSLRKALSQNGIVPASAQVRLKLEDGSDYGFTGTVEFTEVTVDQSTGTVTLRARFPNPQGVLLPGMFVRAVFAQAIDTRAILVPQQAVSRDPKGNATVYVLGAGNKAVQRSVNAPRTQGALWVVTDGLNPGDKVITEGLQNVKPGVQVRPVPAGTPLQIAPQRKGGKHGGQDGQGAGQGSSRGGAAGGA